MSIDCVAAADFCLFPGCKTAFALNVRLDLKNFAARPLNSMIVLFRTVAYLF